MSHHASWPYQYKHDNQTKAIDSTFRSILALSYSFLRLKSTNASRRELNTCYLSLVQTEIKSLSLILPMNVMELLSRSSYSLIHCVYLFSRRLCSRPINPWTRAKVPPPRDVLYDVCMLSVKYTMRSWYIWLNVTSTYIYLSVLI